MEDKLLGELMEILEDEYDYYRELYEKARNKKESIIDNNVERLSELIREEEEILDRVKELEERRSELIDKLCEIYELDNERLSYNELIKHISDPWPEKISPLRDKLLETIEDVSQQNRQNKELIKEAMKLNNFSYNLLMKSLHAGGETYSEKGDKTEGNVNHIIDRRG